MGVITQRLCLFAADDKDDWFEAIDEVDFTQKHKIYNWIKEVVDDNKSRYSKSSSKKS